MNQLANQEAQIGSLHKFAGRVEVQSVHRVSPLSVDQAPSTKVEWVSSGKDVYSFRGSLRGRFKSSTPTPITMVLGP